MSTNVTILSTLQQAWTPKLYSNSVLRRTEQCLRYILLSLKG